MPAVRVDGRSFAYDDTGAGPAVVLLHGLLMDRSMWEPLTTGLSDAYRVVAIDAPGHGDSDPVDVGYDFEALATDVLGVMDAAGVDRAVVGGQSMGGWTALRMQARAPERVRGLILADTSVQVENPDVVPQYEAFLQVALQDGVSEDLAELLLPIFFSPSFTASPAAEPWRKKFLTGEPARFHALARAVFDRPDVSHLLAGVRCPAVVIHGEEDIAISMDRAEQIAEALEAPLHRIPAAGHASPHERPQDANPIIRGFLDSLPPE